MIDDQMDPSPDPTAGLAEAWANLQISIGDIGQQLRADRAARQAAQPIRGPREKAAPVPASGTLVLGLGTPAMGRRWTLRNLSVTDAANVVTPVVGVGNIYVGNTGVYSPSAFRYPLTALPAAAVFDADQIGVIPADHLFVVVTGATPGQVLLARAEVLDYPLNLPRAVMPL